MNDKIKINLQMAGFTFPLTIAREDEEMVRSAAKQVESWLNAYAQNFPQLQKAQLITMAAYQFALESLQANKRNDTAPFVEKVETLNKVLDGYFLQIK